MPYKKSQKPFYKMERLLNSYKINAPKLAEALGVTPVTAMKRLVYPEMLSLKELSVIHRKFHIEWDEIRQAIGD